MLLSRADRSMPSMTSAAGLGPIPNSSRTRCCGATSATGWPRAAIAEKRDGGDTLPPAAAGGGGMRRAGGLGLGPMALCGGGE